MPLRALSQFLKLSNIPYRAYNHPPTYTAQDTAHVMHTSGYEVAKRIKADDRLKDIPVIAVTAYALSGDEEQMIEIGCNDYVSKPYRPRVLIEHLEKFLGPAKSEK